MKNQRGKVLLSAVIMLSMLLSVVLSAPFSKTVNADAVASGSCGTDVTYELDDSGVLTISGTGPMYDYDYPNSPFSSDNNIKSVVINSGVTSIGEHSFEYCINLTSVTIPSSVTLIGRDAFYDCSKLTSVTIPNSVTTIGKLAFANTDITSVTIPSSVTSLDSSAFSHKTASIEVDSNNPNYSSENGIVFNKDKTELVIFPEGKTDTSYTIPSGVTSIGENAFDGCWKLTSVTIPDGVTTIGKYAFIDCGNLKKVVIPESVNQIGDAAFFGSPVTIYCVPGSYAQTYAETKGISFKGSICGTNVSYELDDSGVLTISGTGPMYDYDYPNSPFSSDNNIKSVVINSGVTSIGEHSFEYCINLTSVTIPSSVTLIGRDAFYDCSKLTSVTIPNSVTTIGKLAFANTDITSVTIPSSVTSLDSSAFSHKTASIEVDSNNPNYSSENGIVFNKDKTELVIFPEGKTDTSYTIPSGVTSIGENAFDGCWKLTSVTIPDGVTTIGEYAFSGCGNLKKVVIPESVNQIADAAFSSSPVTIYCAAGSYAQTYAEKKGISYKCWVTVQYETNGGTAVSAQQPWAGESATKPADPTKTGYTFGGWYKDSACTKAYDFNSVVTDNITLYAKWTANPTTAPSDEGGFEAFVERLYTVALGRASEPEGKAFWCEHVGNGDLNGAQCANEFLLSKEFNDRKLTDEQFLTVLYETFFNRKASDDPDGFNFWMNSLKTQGRDVVVDCFINSTEWCNVCAAYGVKSGATRAKATVASKNATDFATRLYTECLGRDPEEDGLKFWSLGLTNLELSGSQAAREFFFSKEIKDMNLTNEQLITKMYKTFMGRDPDTDGMNFWLDSMSNGMTKEQVFNEFVKSKEFTDICKSYAIER